MELTHLQKGLLWNFDREWDIIQVLRQAPSAHAGTELVPWGFRDSPRDQLRRSDPRDLHDLGKLLWRDMGPEADAAFRLVAIDAFFYRLSSHGVGGLLGLRFRYTGGAEREVGYCTVGPRREMQSIDIGDDEVAYLGRYWAARGERRARGDGDEGHDDDESDEGGGNDRGDDEDRNVWGRMRLVVSLHAP